MGSNDILVKEYLESLKEDKELDYLFPILLRLMGFRVITTALESKGQSQYGKDIIAVGKDEDGIKKRFYFELKGYKDKDVTDNNYSVPDGVRESIIEAKDAAFSDSSIPDFNNLPVKIVFVHNGIIKTNIRPTFEGFIAREFPNGQFERWDIYQLTELFTKYLFGEYLFTDEETIRLFKRTLVLLDAPDYDFSDFYALINIQTQKTYSVESRAFKKFFASMNLLAVMIIHYSKENNNLYPARECITFLLLKVWKWVLDNKLETKNGVLKEFRKLLTIHFNLLGDYFSKTNVAINLSDGLFSEAGKMFEVVGYPMRCFDYLNYLNYYLHARLYYPGFEKEATAIKKEKLVNHSLKCLVTLINSNDATRRPVIDNHSIAIIHTILFWLRNQENISNYKNLISGYLSSILNNIVIIKLTRNRFPELYNNVEALTEFAAKNERPHSYIDSSSLLITCVFEILALMDDEKTYQDYRDSFDTRINLQMAYCDLETEVLEPLLFEKNLYAEMYVKTNIKLPENFTDFKDYIAKNSIPTRQYKTDQVGFSFLRYLAHIYFKNEFFPDEWRKF